MTISPQVTIILPTYNERDSLPLIIPQICQVMSLSSWSFDVLVVDDQSPDNTAGVVQELAGTFPVKLLSRRGIPSLSGAVIDGLKFSDAEVCVVMDADGSHPISALPALISPILKGEHVVTVGSRNIHGGGIDDWPWYRQVISKVAALMGYGLTHMTDPTTGFFAVRRDSVFQMDLNPIGWKIGLEIVVKSGITQPLEIPIVFQDRQAGQSKMRLSIQWEYMRHLFRLYTWKFGANAELLIFLFVGCTGMVVDMATVTTLKLLHGMDVRVAAIFGFIVAVSTNYYLNHNFNFKVPTTPNGFLTWLLYVLVCFFGFLVRLCVMHLVIIAGLLSESKEFLIINFIGIISGTIINFLGSKYVVFRSAKTTPLS